MGAIHQTIVEAISSWRGERWPQAKRDALALEVFGHQFAHNAAYRGFCERRGIRPDAIARAAEIPGVPTDVFKHVELYAGQGAPVRTFRTSGTTQGLRGAHHFATLEVYRASLLAAFEHLAYPESPARRLLCVTPSPEELEDSSLSYMLGECVARWGDEGSGFFVRGGRIEVERLGRALDAACAEGVPVALMGTAFAYVGWLDAQAASWSLPAGSWAMETGGLKGRSRELSREALYAMIGARLGLGAEAIVSEYSMTELSSQAYAASIDAGFRAPPWAEIVLVDPVSLQPTPSEVGLIRWLDLANVDSVVAVQTSDRGRRLADGSIALLGRAPDAELRGCSLTIEEILESR